MSVEVIESNSAACTWVSVAHELPESLCTSLIELAASGEGKEVCGFVLADNTFVQVDNVDENPERGFTMDKRQMINVIYGKTPIVATFHSHPSGHKWPSQTDTQNMTFLYQQGCPWRYLIVTAEGVFEFVHRDRS